MGAAASDRTRRSFAPRAIVLALVVAAVWFGGLGHRKLIKPDEGRYAEIPREMVASGDWLTPRQNGLRYFEKPPLQYWATAVAYEAFGASEWTSRLWTAVTGFAGIVVVGLTTARLYDRRTGLFAAAVLASSLGYFLLGHFNTLDMGLTFFMTTTLAGALLAGDAAAHDRPHVARRWMLGGWIALALAVLSKGPVAVLLSGAALAAYVALTRDRTLLRSLDLVRGLAAFAVVAVPWFVAVSIENPGFAHFFFIHEHVERFLTTEHRREGPLWYFVPVVVVGLLPWLSMLPRAIVDGWRARPRGTFAPERLLVLHAAVVFVFFSLSGSKLASYVLPLFPPLAILVGRALGRIATRTLALHLALVAVVAFALHFVAAHALVEGDADAVAAFRRAVAACAFAWAAGSALAAWFALRARATAAIVTAAGAALVAWAGAVLSHESLGRDMSSYDVATRMAPAIRPDTTIYSVGMYDHALDFYLGRTVVLVGFRDELDFGLSQEPARGIDDFAGFIVRWTAERDPLAVMGEDVFATLTRAGLPMRVVARDRHRVVVGKP